MTEKKQTEKKQPEKKEKVVLNTRMCLDCGHWTRRDNQPVLNLGKKSILGTCKGMLPGVFGIENPHTPSEAPADGNEQIIGENAAQLEIVKAICMHRSKETRQFKEVETPAIILRTRKMPLEFTAGIAPIVTAHEFGCVNFTPRTASAAVTPMNAVTLTN